MHRFNDEMYRERGGLGGLDRAREEALEPGPLPITLAAEAIEAKIAELGGRLGARVSDIVNIHDLIYAQALEGASIYWGMRTGAHEIHGAIEEKWLSLDGATGFLGLPVTDELPAGGGAGRYNDFEHGSIYWHPNVGAHEVHGAIRDQWLALGGPTSLGYPTTDESVADQGRFSEFVIQAPDALPPEGANAAMYWSADTGAHLLRGEMLKAWRNQGAQRSFLGYPTSDQASEAPVRFQRGTMRPTARLPEIVPDQRTIMTGQINLDGVAANGRATLLITSAGLWNYSGTVRATGALSYDFRIATALDFADAAGTGRAFFAQGDVEGTLTLGGNREHKWEDWGSDNWIRDNWDALVTCGTHTALTVEFTFDQLMGHIGTILGIPLIVIGVLLAAAFVDDNYDVCGGEDPDGSKHVTFVPKGQSCPPGETKQPRSGAGDTNGDMVGGGGPPG